MSIWQILLELVVVVLLAATLFFALRLERAIAILRRDKADLGDVLSAIRAALDDADRGISSLQSNADISGRALLAEIEASREAATDLQFLVDRLDHSIIKAETLIKSGRQLGAADDAPKPPAVYSKAERDLLKVLRLTK